MKTLSDDGDSIIQETTYQIVSAPLLGTSLYNAIASRASLRSYLQENVYFDPSYVTEEMVDHYSTATHQYGSQYAVQSFIGGQLNHSVRESLPKITPNVLKIIWGREAKQSPLSDAEAFLAAGMLPHDEQASTFNRIVIDLLKSSDTLVR
jgi:hypothetical protein